MSAAPHPATRTVQSLAVLLDLTRRARAAGSVRELAFLAVNDSSQLAPLRQGATWRLDMGVDALSGVLQPEANAPYVQWLDRLARHLHEEATAETAVRAFDSHALPADLAEDWRSWWPAHALWVSDPAAPATDKDLQPPAWLFAREAPWTEDELRLIREWRAAWSHAWTALQPDRPKGLRSAWQRLRRHLAPRADCPWWRQPRVGWAAAALAVLCLPVRMTVMAPAELVPAQPAVVRAPLDGVIATFHVQPNATVAQGQPLFDFDEALIQGRIAVAQQALLTAETERRQVMQQALSDPKFKAQLALLAGKIQEKQAELNFLQDQATRARVLAPRSGVVIFDDPSEWVGKPVGTGERILRIAAPDDREIEAWIPMADAIPLPERAHVKLYLNASPLSPVVGQVRYVAHEAVARPEGGHAYRVRATLTADTEHRVGLKGSARVQGDWTVLIYWMLRRPLASLRSSLGL